MTLKVPVLAIGLSLVAFGQATQPTTAVPSVRLYFIAADEVDWNYTPKGRNLAGLPKVEAEENEGPQDAAGVIYRKAVFREYTDRTFATLKPRPATWEHLGILGPLIRAEVGDIVRVQFKNNTKLMCSLHPHGLAYDKESEGAVYAGRGKGAVQPGETHTYTWRVLERSGPAHGESSSTLWMYHSHFVEGKDINTGLIGPIIVTARGSSKPDGTPKDVDREFVTAFATFDETQSWYFDANLIKQKRRFADGVKPSDPAFREAFLIYSINGLIEGNLPVPAMKMGERVRWYMFALTNDEDVHTPHWHGQTAISHHMRTDMVHLAPMGMAVADMVADNPGTWLFHCHINEHFEGGMNALFTVFP